MRVVRDHRPRALLPVRELPVQGKTCIPARVARDLVRRASMGGSHRRDSMAMEINKQDET